MTLTEIQDKVKHIEEIRADDEAAHGAEDSLYYEFIKYVANGGAEDLQLKAQTILTTANISFCRWCA